MGLAMALSTPGLPLGFHPEENSKLRIGNWNARTLLQGGNAAQVATEMEKQRIELMGISETHWTGQGKIQIDDGMSIIYSGRDDEIHREGVAIMMTKEAGDALIDWVPINERIIKGRFFSKHIKLTMIHTPQQKVQMNK